MTARGMVRVYEVRYLVDDDDPRAHGGAAGDGSFIARFVTRLHALDFARGKHGYDGKPAEVRHVDVPRRLAARWGLA